MKAKITPAKRIEFQIDDNAQEIFGSTIGQIEARLQGQVPGAQIGYRGQAGSGKDAVAVILASATLLAAATPTIVTVVTAILGKRGCDVKTKTDAKGKLTLEVSKSPKVAGTRKKGTHTKVLRIKRKR